MFSSEEHIRGISVQSMTHSKLQNFENYGSAFSKPVDIGLKTVLLKKM